MTGVRPDKKRLRQIQFCCSPLFDSTCNPAIPLNTISCFVNPFSRHCEAEGRSNLLQSQSNFFFKRTVTKKQFNFHKPADHIALMKKKKARLFATARHYLRSSLS